jgi:transposase-like protein
MPKRIAPSAVKAHERPALLQGPTAVERGDAGLSTLGPLATERVLPDALEGAQTELLGRHRSERRGPSSGYRQGDADGTLKTAAGVLRVTLPQSRGGEATPRSQSWAKLAQTRDRLTTRMVEMWGGDVATRSGGGVGAILRTLCAL